MRLDQKSTQQFTVQFTLQFTQATRVTAVNDNCAGLA